MRSILSSGLNTSRRLGLGQALKIQLEGDFGRVSIAPGTQDGLRNIHGAAGEQHAVANDQVVTLCLRIVLHFL